MKLPNVEDMQRITVDEFEAEFEEYLAQAETGKFFLIISDGHPACVLMPFDKTLFGHHVYTICD